MAVLGEHSDADDANARALAAAGADEVLRTCDDRLAHTDVECYAAWLCALALERRPEVILYGATNFGRELAPRVAVTLQTGLTADCTILEMDRERGLLQQTRPAFGGNLMATIVCPNHRPQMATVRPGIFPAPEPREVGEANVTDVLLDAAVYGRVNVLSREKAGQGASIADAPALVVVGRGIGSKKALARVHRLAELLLEQPHRLVDVILFLTACRHAPVACPAYRRERHMTGYRVADKQNLQLRARLLGDPHVLRRVELMYRGDGVRRRVL